MYFPSTIAITHIHTLTYNTHKHNANSLPARLSGLLLVPGGAVWRQPLYKIKLGQSRHKKEGILARGHNEGLPECFGSIAWGCAMKTWVGGGQKALLVFPWL